MASILLCVMIVRRSLLWLDGRRFRKQRPDNRVDLEHGESQRQRGRMNHLPVFPFHTNKLHLPLILVPPADQFRHVFRRMLLAAMVPDAVPAPAPAPAPARPGLRKIAPYWYPYTTMAKGRWLNREILEIVSTEFRDRSIEYYVWFSSSLSLFFFFWTWGLSWVSRLCIFPCRDTHSSPVSLPSTGRLPGLARSCGMAIASKISCIATSPQSRLNRSRYCMRTENVNSL